MTPAYTPEQEARWEIDKQLEAAGWQVQDYQRMNLHAQRGVAVRKFPLKTGFADYLLCVETPRPPGVGKSQTGWRWVSQCSRSSSRVGWGSGT
jgi:type I site-specific restriction endonuclease